MTAREQFWSTTDLPQVLLHEFVDLPFVLRLTCRAMRDAHRPTAKGTERTPRAVVYWTMPENAKTETWVTDLVRSVSRVAWAYDARLAPLDVMVRCAAAVGALPSLRWIHQQERHLPYTHDACYYAAKHGHVHVLEWLGRTAHAHPTSSTAKVAATNGHLECLKWAVEHGCDLPEHILSVCACAAAHGHTDVLVWMVERGHRDVVLDGRVQENAQIHGQTDVLQWLHAL
tara:strand:- start:325 stop:1011 length:687 start_codon:yes stop_codon:yes gene_type:complete